MSAPSETGRRSGHAKEKKCRTGPGHIHIEPFDNSRNPFLGSAVPDQTGNASQKTKQRDATIALYLFSLIIV